MIARWTRTANVTRTTKKAEASRSSQYVFATPATLLLGLDPMAKKNQHDAQTDESKECAQNEACSRTRKQAFRFLT